MNTTCFSSIQDAFESIVADHPEKIAATCLSESITYRQLSERCHALASQLIREGVKPGDLVGLCCERRLEMIVAILAILRAGAGYVPFDSAYPDARLLGMAQDAGVEILIGDFPVFDQLNLKRIPFASFPDQASDFSAPSSDPDSLAYVMFTSGSSGRPKGVAVPHRAILRLVLEPNFCQLGPDEKILQHSPVAFDASTFEIWGALLNGGELRIMPEGEVSLRALGDEIKEAGITSLWLTAGLFHAMVEERPDDFANVKQLLTGGDVVSPKHAHAILKRFPQLRLINGYGPTENTTFTCCHTITAEDVSDGSPVPIGTAISGTDIHIVDENLNPVADGQRGELCCAGSGLALGYWQNEERTSESFVTAPWDPNLRLYRTGDSVVRRSDGVVDFFGRIDQQVKIRGFRIELGEIETRILELDSVQQVSVIAEAVNDNADKVLVANYVSDTEINRDQFREFLQQSLPSHCVPGFYHRLDEIPLTPNGKVDRKKLPSLAELMNHSQPRNGNGHVNGSAVNGSTNGKSKTDTAQQIAAAVGNVLGLQAVPRQTNYFDLGASSIQIARIHERVQSAMGRTFPLTDFFQFPTANSLAQHLDGGPSAAVARNPQGRTAVNIAEPIAVIGFAGRFPGADSVEELWEMICQGKDGLRDLSDEELTEKGVPGWMLQHDRYVKRGADIPAVDELDADLFGISHREAETTDPQGRVFLEVCHDALLHAGYPPEKYAGRIGLFGGAGIRSYSWRKVNYSDLSIEKLSEVVGNEKDFLTTRISYRLGLTGVSIPVQTACSSSLVAIHMARQSLLYGDSDMAIAGGVSLNFPHGTGYMAAEGTMFSMKGRCSVFDQDADGTIFTPGAGAVILKRLADAEADGDPIHAVLMSSGVNNDGNRKIGFTAPSIQGQVDAIHDALGDFDTKDMRYIEAHGTATKLGDPIELTGLSEVYDQNDDNPECLVGSVKSNIGHTDAAAGINGFIKAMLVAKHGCVPPTIHHNNPTDAFDFSNSRFRVNTEMEPLPKDGTQRPLIGVNSFGVGGTNAHVILAPPPQQKPAAKTDDIPSNRPIVVPISAASKKSLKAQLKNLDGLLEQQDLSKKDLAHSLCHTRPDLAWRSPALLTGSSGALKLSHESEQNWIKAREHQGTAFLFTGQGAQYLKMAQGLYENEPVFRETFETICAIADPILGLSLKQEIFEGSAERLGETWLTQPALFAVEVANAKLWQSYGIVPTGLVGHSIGEYAAAVIANVFTLADATRAVVERGRLMWGMPAGKMAVVPLSADAVAELISNEPELELATLNCPDLNVIAGPEEALIRFIDAQQARDITVRLLHTSHAFHTRMMDDVLEPFRKFIESLGKRSAPEIPIYSNVTGELLTDAEATSADYWVKQIRNPVRFEECIRKSLDNSLSHFVEMGPGRTLSTFLRKSLSNIDNAVAVETIRHPKDDACDHQTFLKAVGKFWAHGGPIAWNKVIPFTGKKIALPRYPYDRKRFWRAPDSELSHDTQVKNPDISQWFYRPTWESAAAHRVDDPSVAGDLLVISGGKLSKKFRSRFSATCDSLIHIKIGKEYSELKDGQAVARANCLQDFNAIFASMKRAPARVILAPTTGSKSPRNPISSLNLNRARATETILHAMQASHAAWAGTEIDLTLVSKRCCEVVGGDLQNPADATIRGFAGVIAKEFALYTTRWVDTDNFNALPLNFPPQIAEFAIRNGKLWQANWAQQVIDTPTTEPFRDGQTFVITGGTSGVGLAVAHRLGTQHKVNLVLSARTELPKPGTEDANSKRYQRVFEAIAEIEQAGSQVLVVQADITRPENVASLKKAARDKFGKVHGLFHAAGVLFDRPILLKERITLDLVLRPKIEGPWILAKAFSDSEFLFLFSSISSAIPPAGQCDYASGNNYMDALANQSATKPAGLRIISANWGSWRDVGMAARHRNKAGANFLQEEYDNGIELDEGFECIKRILASGQPQFAVYTRDFVGAYQARKVNEEIVEDVIQQDSEDSFADREPPATPLETELLGLFVQSLKRRDIGVMDCFFDLGGDSLMAVGMLTQIKKLTGFTLVNSILYQAPHVRALAVEIEKLQNVSPDDQATEANVADAVTDATTNSEASANFVIPIAPEGTGAPVFGIHGAGGSVLFFRKTTSDLAGTHPFYAIEDPLVKNSPKDFLFDCITEKAQLYLDEVLKIATSGPIILIGYSFGNTVASEMARLINAKFPGRKVIIINIDQPAATGNHRPLGLTERIQQAWHRKSFSSNRERVIFIARRFYQGMRWNLRSGPLLKKAYKMLLDSGEMHNDEAMRLKQIEYHNCLLDAKYRTEPIDAHMVLLKASDQGDQYAFPNDMDWSELVTSLKVFQIPGDHLSVVSDENQPFMASRIAMSIREALEEPETSE